MFFKIYLKCLQNKKGSALLITLFLTIIISIIALYLLAKIVPVSQNVKGIENGNIAYYDSSAGIEKALLTMSGTNPGYESGATTHNSSATGYVFQTIASGTIIPSVGEGNSEYSTGNWSRIGLGEPLQLIINRSDIDWSAVQFKFRIPDLNQNGVWIESLTGVLDGSGVINWILSGNGKSLFASGDTNMIKGFEIKGLGITLGLRDGIDLNGSGGYFSDFYKKTGDFLSNGIGNCSISNKCTLKLSITNSLLLSDGQLTPYLEYQVNFDKTIPLQYTKIESDGYSFGFKKHISKYIKQITTNEALDFTVFQ